MPRLSIGEVNRLVQAGANTAGWDLRVTEMEDGVVTCKLGYAKTMARPGGSIGGPVIMGLADAAIYAAILAELGPEAMALTASLNCNFLGRAFECELSASARLLKLGSRLAVAEVNIADGDGSLVAHATGTYSLPPGSAVQQADTANPEPLGAASQASIDRGLAAALDMPAEGSGSDADEADAPVIEVSENEYEELSTSDLLKLMTPDTETQGR